MSKHWLLKAETVWSMPWFLLSWLVCSVWYALLAGRDMAKADSETKQTVLEGTLKGKPRDPKPKKILS